MRIGILATAIWLLLLCMGAPLFMWVSAGICALLFGLFYLWTIFYEHFKYKWISEHHDSLFTYDDAKAEWERKHWIAEKFYFTK